MDLGGRDTRFDFLSASFKIKSAVFDHFSPLSRRSAKPLKEPYHADSDSRKANDSESELQHDQDKRIQPHRREEADQHTVLDIREASELLGKTVGTIYSLTSQKSIPFSKRGNKLYFFKDELLAWIKSGGKADIDFRSDENRDAYDRHLLKLKESKRRKPRGGL